MKELIKLWALEINRNNALSQMLKGLDFSFCLKVEEELYPMKINNDRMQIAGNLENEDPVKLVEAKEEVFLSIYSGEQKLRKVVQNREVMTTLTYRELLLFEALFFLAKPKASRTTDFSDISC